LETSEWELVKSRENETRTRRGKQVERTKHEPGEVNRIEESKLKTTG
jgi:hypothetical protein